ncbi:helix-turn-helix domain-containing protein [Aquibacillus halophilus]|uniref:Helix-turn-helix domain-containing protein n=1 Tax=Aquibacillus halophilus TaxID=930132 RepID=A0A6A8D8N7_9BACI|nr:excisionase family DNA-binding protein [Aquibacillus halophilus]MRH42123.1 helix-turn-helix domain-containing protein [Aquibacillus halophilus]
MYLTIKEAAEFIEIPESQIKKFIDQGRIRAIHDGEQYVINKEQFTTHMEQLENYKKLVDEFWNEPIPEDIDIKDED